MAVVVGFVEEDYLGALYNSAALLRHGHPTFVHRKIYLPTYGIFQEQRFLAAGRRLELAPLPWGRAGVLICEDMWHPELARRLALGGTKLLLVPSAAPGRIGGGEAPQSAESWDVLTPSPALLNTCCVVYL